MPERYGPSSIEKRISDLWYPSVYEKRNLKRKKEFFFLDGPPYTSGAIHIGTAWNKIIKDAKLRYLRLKGYRVSDQPGYDMHGLPIEVIVEKRLGIKDKKDIECLGVEKFIQECKSFALESMGNMSDNFKAMGVWMDWENPYKTLDKSYMEREWAILKRIYEKGLLTRAKRVISWCPRCSTALAETEVEYKDKEDPSIYVKFPLKGKKGYIIVWTTTPWTLIANRAVAVNPHLVYVKAQVKQRGKGEKERWVTLKSTLDQILEKSGYELIEIEDELEGEDLDLSYIPPFGIRECKMLGGEFVAGENSGIVHIAPGHGEDDYRLGLEHGLEIYSPIGDDGRFTEEAGEFEGMTTKEASAVVIDKLSGRGLLLTDEKLVHRYGHCWRCKSPIIYRATDQWFIKIEDIKEEMLDEIASIKWYPPWAGSSRERSWVENARDWCISRQRYWGCPLPIWECENGHFKVVGSLDELGVDMEDLHRPWVDEIRIECECGGEMRRVRDVFDVWFDSAVACWASQDKKQQADWIVEAHDQTRGWFYSQLFAGVAAFEKAPYKSVLMHGHALDEEGRPMSKSLGNVIDPKEVAERYGIDALRLYLLGNSSPWEDLAFNWDGVKNAYRALSIFWNVYQFASTYMALDEFDHDKAAPEYRAEDLWLLSRLESLKGEIADHYERNDFNLACRAITDFIGEELSRWYIKLIRDRAWVEGKSPDKDGAYSALYRALTEISTIFYPIAPFISEEIFRGISSKESIAFEVWPPQGRGDEDLEEEMATVRGLVEKVLEARSRIGRNLRWPIKAMAVLVGKRIERLTHVISSQANVKEVKVVKDPQEFKDGWLKEETEFGAIALDLELDEELVDEGYAREIVRRVQSMRKDASLEVEDYISLSVWADDELARAVKRMSDYISREVRGKAIRINPPGEEGERGKRWTIGDKEAMIAISKS
jgi:isoleucyl-tRNA synthetase